MNALPSDFVRPARAKFLDAFDVSRPEGEELYLYDSRQRFYSKKYDRIFEVPPGFRTNFVTGRDLPGIAWLSGTLSDEASGLHDRLYETGEVPRPVADAVFLEALGAKREAVREREKANGVPAWKRGVSNVIDFLKHCAMYIGVRVGGESRYNGPKEEKPTAPQDDIYFG